MKTIVMSALALAAIVLLSNCLHRSAPDLQASAPDLQAVTTAADASLDVLAAGSAEAQASQRKAVGESGVPLEVKTAKTGIAFRLIPAGSFTMGSPENESGRDDDERQHRVTLSKSYYVGKYEVTRGQWAAVMGGNPRRFKNIGKNAPVERVNWDDVQAFLEKLCQLEEVPGGTYRLLTEAEWEYACRAGTKTAYQWGDPFELGMCNAENDKGSSEGKNVSTFRRSRLPVDSMMSVGKFTANAYGFTTCMVTSGNGARIGMLIIRRAR